MCNPNKTLGLIGSAVLTFMNQANKTKWKTKFTHRLEFAFVKINFYFLIFLFIFVDLYSSFSPLLEKVLIQDPDINTKK